ALDCVSVAPGAEIVFSTRSDVTATNGQVRHHGDLLSNQRGELLLNSALVAGFSPTPAGDLGLDAAYIADDGTVYFSTVSNFNASGIGAVSRGDVLAFRGGDAKPNALVKTRQQLLSAFLPANAAF